nr:MAG TPA_asm: hypothetical protein [Bacteriophage sp.]
MTVIENIIWTGFHSALHLKNDRYLIHIFYRLLPWRRNQVQCATYVVHRT